MRMTSKQYREEHFKHTRKKSKYKNSSTMYNGQRYDSKLEAKYAQDLDWRIDAGEVKEWDRQVKLELTMHGKKLCNYYIDFRVVLQDDSVQYVEVKGFPTMLWKLKWDILLASFDTDDCPIEQGADLLVVK